MALAVMLSTSTMPSAAHTGTWTISAALSSKAAFKWSEKPLEAWWLTTSFRPDKSGYFGLRADQIDPSWSLVTVLSYDNLPPEAREDLAWMKRDGFKFHADRTDRRGRHRHFATGVFQKRNGAVGKFLVVLESTGAGKWRVAYLHQEPGAAGFSVMKENSTALYWGTCMMCSDFRRIVSSGDKIELEH